MRRAVRARARQEVAAYLEPHRAAAQQRGLPAMLYILMRHVNDAVASHGPGTGVPVALDVLVAPVPPVAGLTERGGATALVAGQPRPLAHVKHAAWISQRKDLERLKADAGVTEVHAECPTAAPGRCTQVHLPASWHAWAVTESAELDVCLGAQVLLLDERRACVLEGLISNFAVLSGAPEAGEQGVRGRAALERPKVALRTFRRRMCTRWPWEPRTRKLRLCSCDPPSALMPVLCRGWRVGDRGGGDAPGWRQRAAGAGDAARGAGGAGAGVARAQRSPLLG